MSTALFAHSPDLQRLRDDGYDVVIIANHLVVRNVPYVTDDRSIARGWLISPLTLRGDTAEYDGNHVVHFTGEYPCDQHGNRLQQLINAEGSQHLAEDLLSNFRFSQKPPEGYRDYHHKMSSYTQILAQYASAIDPLATAVQRNTTPAAPEAVSAVTPSTPFRYADTASTRAGVEHLNGPLRKQRIGIIGLGGTGSYILDLLSKTPVQEIHLYDDDVQQQHNAFRSPGATPVNVIEECRLKVDWFAEMYGAMKCGIHAHTERVTRMGATDLEHLDFVFVAVDSNLARFEIRDFLDEHGIAHIDVGMGIELTTGGLRGQLRVSANHQEAPAPPTHISDLDDVYASNIQIAELNAANAALAVIKWKRMCGFYLDQSPEPAFSYQIGTNLLTNLGGTS